MPLQQGKAHIGGNIHELMASYEADGKIGNTRPGSRKKALQIAVAIAMRKAGRKR